MNEINVGIIGFGFMGKVHTYAYKTIPLYYSNLPYKINLIGICTPRMEIAEKAKEELGFEYATTNISDIMNDKRINVVNICTPNIYHKDTILQALNAGKNIYCDKPLTVKHSDAQEIISEVQRIGNVTQLALQYRFYPATMRAKEIIDEGRLGRILSFRACYLHSGSVDANKPIGWKQNKDIGGGGVLFDLGSHILDLLYHLMGEYKSVFAKTQIIHPMRPDKTGKMVEITADDAAYIIANMKNGATGTVEATKIATGANDELRFEIHGDKGAIRFNLMEPNWLEFYDNTLDDAPLGGTKGYTKIECVQRYPKPGSEFPGPKFSVGWIRGHVHCLYNFLTCLADGKQANPSFLEGAYIQYVMEKAYESACFGVWKELD